MFICVLNESLKYESNMKKKTLAIMVIKKYLSDFDMYLME